MITNNIVYNKCYYCDNTLTGGLVVYFLFTANRVPCAMHLRCMQKANCSGQDCKKPLCNLEALNESTDDPIYCMGFNGLQLYHKECLPTETCELCGLPGLPDGEHMVSTTQNPHYMLHKKCSYKCRCGSVELKECPDSKARFSFVEICTENFCIYDRCQSCNSDMKNGWENGAIMCQKGACTSVIWETFQKNKK